MTLLPSDLAAVIEAVTTALPDWDHTQPAAISSMSHHIWTHPTDQIEIRLSHWLTGTRWRVQLTYEIGGAEEANQELRCREQAAAWVTVQLMGATTGRLSLAGAR